MRARAEPAPRLDDEQVAQRELALAPGLAALVEQPLRAREHARRREQLDRHVGQPLELLLPLDDLLPVRADHAARPRSVELGDVLLEVRLRAA